MSDDQPKCPVDHSAREVWLKQNSGSGNTPVAPHPVPSKAESNNTTADKCPVDHEARGKWMEFSKNKSQDDSNSNLTGKVDGSSYPMAVETHSSDSLPDTPIYTTDVKLPTDREISSIPRTGAQSNWIYPSQKQFFEAMKRKNWDPTAEDMETVVPIHNAVNERAWYQILKWEEGQGSESCGGLQLTSFKGDSKKLTPKARWKLMLGYQKPFDRHDWTINRCGKEVDYVIDFYAGKPSPLAPNMASFYLDVRPKLNSIEGVKLRVSKFFGF